MEYYVTQTKDYWIANNAVSITLNALGEKNRIQGGVASGAVIMCFVEDIKAESEGGEPGNGDGLWYGSNHEPKRWPLSLSPTYFNSDTHKYVYAAIPRSTSVGSQAFIVFPSEELDIYGRARRLQGANESYEQIGSTDYFYVFLQGIISAPQLNPETNKEERGWERKITDWGKLSTTQGMEERMNSSDWYTYSEVNQLVTFLKEIAMHSDSSFRNLILNHKNLTDVATSTAVAPIDSDTMVATPNYISKFYLSKVADDVAAGHITFQQGLQSVLTATFGTYNREAGTTPTGAAIQPDGTGDFIDLIVKGMVRGNLTVEDLLTAKDIIFKNELKSEGARRGFSDGTGIYMNAKEGLIETDGMNVRGFMRVMELIINRLQLMESDYSFTEGDTVDHIDYEDNGQTLVLTMHKDHDTDFTPFYPGDIIYGIVNLLLERADVVGHEQEWEQQGYEVKSDAVYYHTWMRVKSVDHTHNKIRVALFQGKRQDNTAIVPGGTNFSPYGTAITTDVTTPMYEEYEEHGGEGYDTMLTVTRHGNVADGINPDTGQYDEHIHQSQLGRQQSWVLSTTDKRLSFFWRVDAPIIADDNYALCLGILPDLANLPITRNPDMPSLYVNTLFVDDIEQANYPARVVKTDRGQWQQSPTATYEGDVAGTWTPDGTTHVDGDQTTYSQHTKYGATGVPQTVAVGATINEPYHFRTFTKSDWLAKRLSTAWRSKTDAELERMMLLQSPKADLEVSRVWNNGIIWECLTDGTNQAPIWSCTDWLAVGGDTIFYCEITSSAGTTFRNGNVDTILTMETRFGQEDITDRLLQTPGATVQWIRKTGWDAVNHCFIQTSEDRAWQATQGATAKSIVVVRSDMGSGWMIDYRQAMFCCSIYVPEGNASEVTEYSADFIQKA